MKTTLRPIALSIGICLMWLTTPARAENFIVAYNDFESETFVDVDVDSLRTDNEGFTYAKVRTEYGDSDRAVNCSKRTVYLINDGQRADPNWRDHGQADIAEHLTDADVENHWIIDFVCARTP
jgi:hypothetical protein